MSRLPPSRDTAALVLAAGPGHAHEQRYCAKVLHQMAGAPLLGHVLGRWSSSASARTLVVIGHQRERVRDDASATPASSGWCRPSSAAPVTR